MDAFITDLDYVHMWWTNLFSAIAIVYLGMKAYFTDLDGLHQLTFDFTKDVNMINIDPSARNFDREKQVIISVLEEGKGYLNPDFNLKDLAEISSMTKNEVSEVVNSGFGLNFNELINQYRVEEVKKRIIAEEYSHLSLVALAFDSGFNSKATFNRVFKKSTGQSPSEYKTSQIT